MNKTSTEKADNASSTKSIQPSINTPGKSNTNKSDQAEYIEYLEHRLAKLSENSTIGDSDLDTLIDTQNEIIINSSYDLKRILNQPSTSAEQVASLQNKIVASDAFIDYLMNSFWWKATQPFRLIARQFKKRRPVASFDFSTISVIEAPVKVYIYAESANSSLEAQIDNIKSQSGFKDLTLTIIDINNSPNLAQIAKLHDIEYLTVSPEFSVVNSLAPHPSYAVYLKQGVFIENTPWLYQMVRPLVDNYTHFSALYDANTSRLSTIKKETYFNELKSRIFTIGNYECLLLPTSRNHIQYIPSIITDETVAVAKSYQ